MPIQLLTIHSISVGDKTIQILKFSGDLVAPQMDDCAEDVDKLLDSTTPPHYLIIDLADVGYMSSKGIGYITGWHMRATDQNGKLVLCSAQANVKDVLDTLGITSIVPYMKNFEDATHAF